MTIIIKRLGAVALGSLGLACLAPMMMFLAGFVFLTIGPPVLVHEAGKGWRGEPVPLLAFRALPGSFLRQTSLDKLPRLFNVIREDCGIDALWF